MMHDFNFLRLILLHAAFYADILGHCCVDDTILVALEEGGQLMPFMSAGTFYVSDSASDASGQYCGDFGANKKYIVT